ncbi:hypothetical protein [Mesorhizobium sp. M0047]|uniref:hypothetical protein n=1 Tax=Mesorhizobium sp. M0047 TaxID=2956859 RepID=UPI00333B3190
MPKTLYGLLVAIDEYRSPVPRLNGCVNDIDAVRTYFWKSDLAAGSTSICGC